MNCFRILPFMGDVNVVLVCVVRANGCTRVVLGEIGYFEFCICNLHRTAALSEMMNLELSGT
jgi:hypothetical protein